MKKIIRIFLCLLTIAVCMGIGFYVGFSAGKDSALAIDMAETVHYSDYMLAQLTQGTPDAQEEALLGFLASLEKRKGKWTPWFTQRVYSVDSAITNARLSALATTRGDYKEAERFINQAISFCGELGWRECSAEKILEVAEKLNKHGLFGSESSK